ncbi:aspartate carbamoyltransferase catalytic subunit [Rhodococcus sp. 14-2470-1a]|uniref:aspartate carbamoyltransferase catalytic subunit n=1 Tax=Rhodococcus sp. 14-2470-1a TaxID=2023150 RepID=UPI000B9B4AD2|nr:MULTISPECIES: aspartate carbamoyltransferase catalytic subunit [unclassified Rhodococcus (in: high G+C Gram-positive bacteria)]OZD60161.1 aspartate carbamoyltransferase [Rhodococcus sp. 06-1059B-a]OZF45103.1 aspartate carbamoyltransferase [Rhodococcus sp. 14-2470-1a]
MKHLLSVADLSRESATELLDDADRFEQALLGREVKKLPTLRGRTVMTVFFENSTRTRVSFEVAGKWMSADVINVSASSSSVSKGESLRDTAMTLRAAGADALIVRHPASGAAHQIAKWTAGLGTGGSFDASASGFPGRSAGSTSGGPSVINAGDGTHEHPTQALLDALTLRQRLGDIEGKRIGIVGDILHSRVARSNAILLSTLGAEVVLIAPPTLLPVGASTWPVRVSHSIDAELPALDAVLMLRVQAERMNGGFFPSPKEYSITYGLSQKRLDLLPEHAVVLHPGPMLRGMEIASSVADSPRTAVLQQVTNGVHVRMAVLFRLLVGSDGGAL